MQGKKGYGRRSRKRKRRDTNDDTTTKSGFRATKVDFWCIIPRRTICGAEEELRRWLGYCCNI